MPLPFCPSQAQRQVVRRHFRQQNQHIYSQYYSDTRKDHLLKGILTDTPFG